MQPLSFSTFPAKKTLETTRERKRGREGEKERRKRKAERERDSKEIFMKTFRI